MRLDRHRRDDSVSTVNRIEWPCRLRLHQSIRIALFHLVEIPTQIPAGFAVQIRSDQEGDKLEVTFVFLLYVEESGTCYDYLQWSAETRDLDDG